MLVGLQFCGLFLYKQRNGEGKGSRHSLTVTVDDAGSGDLLFGIVIGAYREETSEFCYDVIDVKFFQPALFRKKEYLTQTTKIVKQLLDRLQPTQDEEINVCQGYIFDEAVEELREIYGDQIHLVRVVG